MSDNSKSKSKYPEEGDLVICTVKRILSHCAFVNLERYGDQDAMLHISEVSSKWVKDIKNHLSAGQRIVCKVLDVKKDKGHVDVSLKGINEAQKKSKLNAWKMNKKIKNWIEGIAEDLGKEDEVENVTDKVREEHGTLNNFLKNVRDEGYGVVDDLDIEEDWIGPLKSKVKDQIKSNKVKLVREMEIKCLESDGIERIKNLLQSLIEFAKENDTDLDITYLSSPEYRFTVKARSYKMGEDFLDELMEKANEISSKENIKITK